MFEGVFENRPESNNASGIIPGFMRGVVKENWDEKHPGCIKVELYLVEEKKNVTGWIPVMTPYGGTGFGLYMLPEIDSEVVVAFYLGEWDSPVVLGSLWNSKYKHPEGMPTEKNTMKCLVTKGGHKLLFGEEEKKETLEIQTPGKLTILLNDEEKSVTIKDENGDNALLINGKDGEISIKAKKKIAFQVDGKEFLSFDGKALALQGDQINGEAKQTLEWKGQSTKLAGNTVEIKGDSTLKVESSGMTEVKGSMLKLN